MSTRLEDTGFERHRPWSVRWLRAVVGINLLAIVFYLLIAIRMGFFLHVEATLFSSPDSHVYRDVANWLFGAAPNPFESQRRPFLYPLLLGTADRLGGATGIWALNFICWIGALNLTSAGVWRMTRRPRFAAIVFLVLASNVSLIALSFQALTELTTALLEGFWILGLAFAAMPPAGWRDFVLLLAPLTLLTVVRPGNELALLTAAILVPFAVWRLPGNRNAALVAVAVACVPLLIQVGLMAVANHFIGLSTAGADQFKNYYSSQVYASVYGLPADLASARLAVNAMSNQQLTTFLIEHFGPSTHVFLANLRDNLTAGSNFIDPVKDPALAALVTRTNKLYALAHIVFVPIVAIALWRTRDLRLAALAVFLAILVVLCSLINTQGDRYVEMALPLWAAAYALATSELLPIRHLSGTSSLTQSKVRPPDRLSGV